MMDKDSFFYKVIYNITWYAKFWSKRVLLFFARIVPDTIYLKHHFYKSTGYKLDLKNPQSFNEKLNWMKLYDRNSIYTRLADKYEVREYVKERIGDKYLIPLVGVWNNAKDIDFEQLPNQFVLKCTHDSGSAVVCKDKSKLDISSVVKGLNKALKENYYYFNREWAYKNITRRIVAEEYIEDSRDKELRDYKFFCFDGIPRMMYIAASRGIGELTFDYFDMEFNHLDVRQYYPNAEVLPHKPDNFELMKELAQKLSKGIDNVRIDFYGANGNVYFGEMTFYNNGGTTPYTPREWDYKFGEWMTLKNKK